MQGNRSYANRLGCIIENNRSNSAKIYVRSSGDRFEDNGLGCQIGGALVAAAGVANSNTTTFEAHGTHFTNNTRTVFFNETGPAFTDLGGLLVVGAEVALAGAPNTTSGNTVVVRLWGSKIAENQQFDFQAFGAARRHLASRGRTTMPWLNCTGSASWSKCWRLTASLRIRGRRTQPPSSADGKQTANDAIARWKLAPELAEIVAIAR